MTGGRNRQDAASLKCRAPYRRVQVIPRSPDRSFAHANSTQSCRPREALLSSGTLCRKSGIPISGKTKTRGFFGMRRLRIGLALAGMAVCVTAFAQVAPHARDSFAILAAQADPAALAALQGNSAMRNNPALVADNIEAALTAEDADLAASFVELAHERNIAVSDELSKRVSDAVTETNSSSHFAKRFATGLVTGNADDVASLSGTVAGDLLVFGDIRDVVGEGKHLAMGEDTDRLVLGLALARLAGTAGARL